jgi:hypothetical protein
VNWVTTGAVVTGVTNVLTFGDGAEGQFVGDTVSASAGRSLDYFWEPSVTLVHNVPSPGPTSSRTGAPINMTPEPRVTCHLNTIPQEVTR